VTEYAPQPGWYIRLEGHDFDLADWRDTLSEPFDPVAILHPDGETLLSGQEFHGLLEPSEVRERGKILIARLNGALSLSTNARPVKMGPVINIDGAGQKRVHTFMQADGAVFRVRGSKLILTAYDPDGNVIPPSPPIPSEPQRWIGLAQENDNVSDMLDHFGRADNWYDIYKTIEFAEHVAGGEHRLKKRLSDKAKAAKHLKMSANFFRHAKAYRPPQLLSLNETRPVLADVVRAAISVVAKVE